MLQRPKDCVQIVDEPFHAFPPLPLPVCPYKMMLLMNGDFPQVLLRQSLEETGEIQLFRLRKYT